ncbi:centriolin-like [Palaemon carinicauda]|uniref:centriolin-like n=1 Tax=Palaemon carinicauda TaxID=392227 RepID=UPI0035B66B99
MPKAKNISQGRYFLRSAPRQDEKINPGEKFTGHSRMINVDPLEDWRSRNPIAKKCHLKKRGLTQHKEEGTLADESYQLHNATMQNLHDEAERLRQQLDEQAREKASLEKSLQEKEQKASEQRYKLRLFKGHLDLIASTLEERDPGKHLILNLLKEMPE